MRNEAQAAMVELQVWSTPAVVEVYLDGVKIGSSAAPIWVPKSGDSVRLTFRTPGYESQTLEVPLRSGPVSVRLQKSGTSRRRGDLEF
jgi:HSP20 family molecular chaperone IbpA